MTTSTATAEQPQYDNSLAGARAWFAHNGLTRPRNGRLPLWVMMPSDD